MKSANLLFIACSSFHIAASAVSESCYNPFGSLTTDKPCNTTTSTGHSACCSKGRQCMTSGLCYDRGLIVRGSCTDPTFKDANCAQYCVDWNVKSGCAVVPRRWTTGGGIASIGWCCDFPLTNGSCAQGFEIKVQAGYPFDANSAETTSASASGAQGSPTASNPAETAKCSLSTDAIDGGDSATAKCAGNHDVAIGVGIGVPALIAIVSLLALWLWERRRRGAAKLAGTSQEPVYPTSYPVSSCTASQQLGGSEFVSPLSVKQVSEMEGVVQPQISEVDGTPALHDSNGARPFR